MQKLQSFSIRKLTVGVTSVVIGLTFLGISQQVSADTTNAATPASEQVSADNKNSNQQDLQLNETHTDVAPAHYLPDNWKDGYQPIVYQNKDAAEIKPYDDPDYPVIRGAKGWTGFAWYHHENKQHGKGWTKLTPIDNNDLSKGYQVPPFEADVRGEERVAQLADGSIVGYYPGDKDYQKGTMAAGIDTYVTITPDPQIATITVKENNNVLGTVTLNGVTGLTSAYNDNALLAKLDKAGYKIISNNFKNGFVYDNTDNDYFGKKDNDIQKFVIEVAKKDAPTTKVENETKTVTRTIHYVHQDGTKIAEDKVETITLTRTKTTNPDGKITYGNWTTGTYGKVVSPVIDGYTPDKTVVEAQPATNTVEVTVTYTKNNVPTPDPTPMPEPSPEPKPQPTPIPEDPTPDEEVAPKPHASEVPEEKTETVRPHAAHVEAKKVSVAHAVKSETVKPQAVKAELPQTGEKDTSILGLIMAAFAGAMAFLGLGKKKHNN